MASQASFNRGERAVLDAMIELPSLTHAQLSEKLDIPQDTFEKRLVRLKAKHGLTGDPDAPGKIIAKYTAWIERATARGDLLWFGDVDFRTLEERLALRSRREWPNDADVTAGYVYRADEHLKEIDLRLTSHRRCLLIGQPASGKSVLAVMLAIQWRTEHPWAEILFLDIPPGADASSVRRWAERIGEGLPDDLYLIDNSHVAPEAVNTLFRLIADAVPSVIFVSAARSSASGWGDDPDEYVTALEDLGAAIEVHPESLYLGILYTYSAAFTHRSPGKFVTVEEDLRVAGVAEKLERLCAHNLISTHALVEAWRECGGRLSDVGEDAVLRGLARRFLADAAAQSIATMAVLAQFEVAPHQHFIRKLPQDEVDSMQRQGLLVSFESHRYGRCYQIDLHPQEASLIWRAWLRWQSIESPEEQAAATLEAIRGYVVSAAPNLIELYRQLHAHGEGGLQYELMCDSQARVAIDQWLPHRPVREALWYLSVLRRLRVSGAVDQITTYLTGVPKERVSNALRQSGGEFPMLAHFLMTISPALGQNLLSGLAPEWVAARLSEAHPSYIERWLGDAEGASATRLGYDSQWRRNVAEHIDLDPLIRRLRNVTPLVFNVCIKGFVEASPDVARRLLERLQGELPRRFSRMGLKSAGDFLRRLREAGSTPEFVASIAEAFQMSVIVEQARTTPLRRIYWLLRELRRGSPTKQVEVLYAIGPQGFAARLREPGATVHDLGLLEMVWPPQFGREVASALSDDNIDELFGRSALRDIGALVEHKKSRYDEHYKRFAARQLGSRLAERPIADISAFLARMNRIPAHRGLFVTEAIEMLLRADLKGRVANTEAEHVALLLSNVHNAELTHAEDLRPRARPRPSDCAALLFDRADEEDALERALRKSRLWGLNLLLTVGSTAVPSKLPRIIDLIGSLDVREQIRAASAEEVTHFLWSAYQFMGAEASRQYCRTADRVCDAEWLASNDLAQIVRLLWNVAQIGEFNDISMLRDPTLWHRIATSWPTNPGLCARFVGIATVVGIDVGPLDAFDIPSVQGSLTAWMSQMAAENHPYPLAQALRGIEAIDAQHPANKAGTKMLATSRVAEWSLLLREALDSAVTGRSQSLLRHQIDRAQPSTD